MIGPQAQPLPGLDRAGRLRAASFYPGGKRWPSARVSVIINDDGQEDNMVKEIKAAEMDCEKFIAEQVQEIRAAVGDGTAINALSGGVDSSTVTMLGHRALGQRCARCSSKTA